MYRITNCGTLPVDEREPAVALYDVSRHDVAVKKREVVGPLDVI